MIIDAQCTVGKGIDTDLSADDLIAAMDANGVTKAVIAPVDRYLAVYNREGNDDLLAAGRRHPGRLYPLATSNPWYGEKALEELKRAFEEGAVGLKLHPPLQGFKITDSIVNPLLKLAAELKKPVYFHTGTPIYCMPFQLTETALRFPEVAFIMGHMGYSDFWYDVTAAARGADNIFLETSPYWPPFISSVVKEIGAARVMFGSGIPLNPQELGLESIRRCPFGEEDKSRILGGTAQSVFFGNEGAEHGC